MEEKQRWVYTVYSAAIRDSIQVLGVDHEVEPGGGFYVFDSDDYCVCHIVNNEFVGFTREKRND